MNTTSPPFTRLPLLIVALWAGVTTPDVQAEAFCALRDPVNTIYELFPTADGYRSNVKTVGRDARQTVLQELPLAMHFNELGRHTLYVAQKDGRTIGYVHARSEMSEWGLTEFAWAFTPNLTVSGVKIQRSRDPLMRRQSATELSTVVAGKNIAMLRVMYDESLNNNDRFLATLLASALKTIVITRTVWQDEIDVMDPVSISRSVFPSAMRFSPVQELYDARTLTMLAALDLTQSAAFDRTALVGYTIEGADGGSIGLAVHSPFDLDDPHRQLVWIVSPSGEIARVYNSHANEDDSDFGAVVGYAPESQHDCATVADIAALEIATLARRHLNK